MQTYKTYHDVVIKFIVFLSRSLSLKFAFFTINNKERNFTKNSFNTLISFKQTTFMYQKINIIYLQIYHLINHEIFNHLFKYLQTYYDYQLNH